MFSPEFMWVSSYVLDMSCNWGIVWSSCTLGEPSGAGVSRQSWDPLGKPDNLDAEKDIELFNNNCSILFLRFLMVKSKFIFSAQESALFGRGAFVSQRPHWNWCCLILIQCCKTRWILQGQNPCLQGLHHSRRWAQSCARQWAAMAAVAFFNDMGRHRELPGNITSPWGFTKNRKKNFTFKTGGQLGISAGIFQARRIKRIGICKNEGVLCGLTILTWGSSLPIGGFVSYGG